VSIRRNKTKKTNIMENTMTLKKLKQEANVISSMVIGNNRDRIFKLNGEKFLVEENTSTGEHRITKQ